MQYGSDVVPLIKRLKYDPKFDPAFRQVSLHSRQMQCIVVETLNYPGADRKSVV